MTIIDFLRLVDCAMMTAVIRRTIFSQQNPVMIKETILRWCQEVTQFYKVNKQL
jgi:hypothetical protein